MINPRIQAIEQEILALAQPEAEQYSGINGGWAKAVVKSWNENPSPGRLATLRDILDTGYQHGGYGYAFSSNELENQITKLFNEWNDTLKKELEQKIAELENKLAATETEQQQDLAQLQALNHELNEIQTANQGLLNDIHQHKQTIQTHRQTINNLTEQAQLKEQRILALEADKTDLINQLAQAQQKHQDYLSQEKSFLQREIQLIKEALRD